MASKRLIRARARWRKAFSDYSGKPTTELGVARMVEATERLRAVERQELELLRAGLRAALYGQPTSSGSR